MVKIKDEDGGDDGPHGAKKGKYGGGDMKASHSHDSNIQLTRKELKLQKRERLSKTKKNYDLIQEAVALWEQLRPKTTSEAQKKELVNKIMASVQGKVSELVNQHTASRIIQFCLKNGSKEQQASIYSEVKTQVLELSKSKHGHHLVQRLIAISKKDDLPGILSQFKGKVAELLRHPRAVDVLVDLYDVCSTSQRNSMVAEMYGKEFALFDGVSQLSGQLSGLKQLLEGANVAKRRSIYQHMTKAIQPVLEKALLHPPMVHRLVREFLECSPSMAVEDAVDTLTQAGTDALKMVHTHDGSAAMCMILAYGSAKDRKRVLKAMKGHVSNMAVNEWGHVVLCMALSVVDDTALVIKTIIAELKVMLSESVSDPYAHRILMQLLSPYNQRYLPQVVVEMMTPPTRTVQGSSGKMITDLEGDEDEVDVHAVEGGGGGGGGGSKGWDGFKMDDDGGEGDEELFVSKAGKKGKGNKKKVAEVEAEGEEEEAAAPAPAEKKGQGKAKDKGKGKGKAEAIKPSKGEEEEEEAEEVKPSGPRTLGLSKKDPLLRRKELLSGGGSGKGPASASASGKGPASAASSFGAMLAQLVASKASTLLRTPHSSDVVVEVARGGDGGVLSQICPETIGEVQVALATAMARSKDEAEEGAGPSSSEHILTHYFASRALRRLVLSNGEEDSERSAGECGRKCIETLWSLGLKGRCKLWFGGHADKVLAAFVKCGVESVAQEASKEIGALMKGKDVATWAEGFVTRTPQKKTKVEKDGKQLSIKAELPSVVAVAAPRLSVGGKRKASKEGAAVPAEVGKKDSANSKKAKR